MKHIKITAFAFIAIFLASCGSNGTTENDPAGQLETYRKQQTELNEKIDALQKQMAADGNGQNVAKIPVVVSVLEATTFHHFFDASGAVVAVQEAMISPELNGQIKEINVKEGDHVAKGQLLVRLNTEVTEKTIEEVKTQLELAVDVYNRQKRLWEQKVGSEMQYLQASNNKSSLESRLATLQAQLDMAVIKAPFDGVVEKVNQKKGEIASPGMAIIHLVNLNRMYVRADVSEKYLASVHKGDTVVLTLPSYPEFRQKVLISRTGNVVNKNNRTFEVEITVDNKNQMLKPNMIAVVNINDFSAPNSVVVPSKVIREDIKGKYLYAAVNENGSLVARKKYVVPGQTYLEQTLITSGLAVGEQIIVEGYNRVSDGSQLNQMQ